MEFERKKVKGSKTKNKNKSSSKLIYSSIKAEFNVWVFIYEFMVSVLCKSFHPLNHKEISYIYTFIHTYIRTYIHTFIHSYIHSSIHTCIRTCSWVIPFVSSHTINSALCCVVLCCVAPFHFSIHATLVQELALSKVHELHLTWYIEKLGISMLLRSHVYMCCFRSKSSCRWNT